MTTIREAILRCQGALDMMGAQAIAKYRAQLVENGESELVIARAIANYQKQIAEWKAQNLGDLESELRELAASFESNQTLH